MKLHLKQATPRILMMYVSPRRVFLTLVTLFHPLDSNHEERPPTSTSRVGLVGLREGPDTVKGKKTHLFPRIEQHINNFQG